MDTNIFKPLSCGLDDVDKLLSGQMSIFEYEKITGEYSGTKIVPQHLEEKIDNIKLAKENDKAKRSPIKPIQIAEIKSNSSVINTVAVKNKEELDLRNKDLLRVRNHPYIKKKNILTDAEKKCYKYMQERFSRFKQGGNVVILSKVRLADIVELNVSKTRDEKAFYKIAYKHVDYAIMSSNLDLICIVELDDYTHENEKAQLRDKFIEEIMQDCGIPFYRIKTKVDMLTPLDTKQIELCVLEYLAPICPDCGRPMEPKESGYKTNYGHRFYGCLGWYEKGMKKCYCTIDID